MRAARCGPTTRPRRSRRRRSRSRMRAARSSCRGLARRAERALTLARRRLCIGAPARALARPCAVRRELVLAQLERARLLDVLAHVARPVRDDPPVGVAIPRVAARPRGAGEARLQRAVAGLLDVLAHLQRAAAARA